MLRADTIRGAHRKGSGRRMVGTYLHWVGHHRRLSFAGMDDSHPHERGLGMRYIVAILEALLALGFFATVVYQLIGGKFGGVDIATDLVLAAIGLWLAKKAMDNFKTKPELMQT